MSIHELVPLINSSHFLSAILLYAGPDQILPLMSVLGGDSGSAARLLAAVCQIGTESWSILHEQTATGCKKDGLAWS